MRYLLWVAVIAVVVQACTIVNQPPPPPKTQLQTREFQTREFDTNDTKLILKAVLNVLQDDGFVVKNAVPDLGLLTATKEIQLTNKTTTTNSSSDGDMWADIFASVFRTQTGNRSRTNRSNTNNDNPTFAKFKQIEVSVNVSELGKRSKVRANFQAKVLDNVGNPVEVYVVEDQKFYQEFFAKVDKGVFIQKQGF